MNYLWVNLLTIIKQLSKVARHAVDQRIDQCIDELNDSPRIASNQLFMCRF